jgi:hypothetical protein
VGPWPVGEVVVYVLMPHLLLCEQGMGCEQGMCEQGRGWKACDVLMCSVGHAHVARM